MLSKNYKKDLSHFKSSKIKSNYFEKKQLNNKLNLGIILALSFIIFILIITTVFIGCSNNDSDISSNQSVESINVASLKGPSSIGIIKIYDEKPKILKRININYEIVPTPDVMVSKILSGEIDMATLPTNVAIKLYNKNTKIKIAAIVGYNNLYLLNQNLNGLSITNWQDLKSKEIYVTSKGSTPDIVLRYLFEKNNINLVTDVKINYSADQIEVSQLLIAKKIDNAVLPEPFVTSVINKNNKISIIFDLGKEWEKITGSPLPLTCLIVSEKVSENKPLVDEFLKLYEESINWVNQNPKAASELVEKLQIGVDKNTALNAIPRCNIKFTFSDNLKEEITNYASTLLDFSPEDIGGKAPDEGFYYK